ncbi:protein transport protein Sec31A isoform X2 [Scleropages formosus]|uniref:Protein transport protein Sec31A n=1 Tax=Scleropages formosus TaxID=113540 RepID=A0A8C9RBQ6_SCLFO|nr:protein transport protein Sec31A isoform X2 [Scleropages formosus]
MKLKEIDRTAIQAWSPAQHHPIYLATGTSAQQLDATFSTSASLEIFELDLADLSLDMKPCGTFSSSHRYHRLVWGPHGMDSEAHPSGVLIAGGENGNVILYDPAKIIAGDSEVIIAQNNKHTGPVRALDVNSYQTNLIASGGNESEIYIWDLNNFGSPMTPGPKTQPLEDISCVAWNGQVQHILASASPSGRASVWDLRKNDLIIKVSDHSNRMHCSGLAWNPEVATQLVLASEDDRMPVIQVWDLRFATSPLKVLENHTRGVLAIAWSLADPELLLSCGKDNRILCWNPNTAEVLYELPTSTQWCFDIQWCPRNPALLSAAAFDGHISIYSIMGGNNDCQRQKNTDQLSSSFGNLDPFGTGQALPPLQLPQPSATKSTPTPLKKPPKWIRVPVGASFAFGGKLVTLENVMANPQQPHQPAPLVHVNQVVTETAFLDRSNQLQAAMTAGNFADFCQSKIKAAENEFERTVWSFLKVNFENDTRGKYLELLGYNKEELALKISAALQKDNVKPKTLVSAPDAELAPSPESQKILEPDPKPKSELDLKSQAALELNSDPEPELDLQSVAEPLPEPQTELKTEPGCDLESEQIVASTDAGLQEEEVDLEELGDKKVEEDEAHLKKSTSATEAIKLRVSEDVDGLITQALLTGDFEGAVNLCLHDNRMADSIILAIAGGQELLEKTQKKYFGRSPSKITKLISAVVTRDWQDILETCDLQNWKEALAAIMTYARPEEFSTFCELLGSRLEASGDLELRAQACLCYVCAGNVEKLVACWTGEHHGHSPLSLQDLVEKVVVLQRAVQQTKGATPAVMGALWADKMSHYANLLASQGSLVTAAAYLPDGSDQPAVQHLRERLRRALGDTSAAPTTPSLVPGRQPATQARTSARPAFAPGQQPHSPVTAPAQAMTPAPQYYQQVRSASTVTSWSDQTPTALPSFPPPLGSASDPQAEPFPPGFGMQPLPNPSVPVSAASGYMYSQQYPQIYPQVQQYSPGAGGPSIYQPQQYASPAAPPLPASSAAAVYQSQYLHPAPLHHPLPPVFVGGSALPSPSTSSFSPPPLSSGASFQHSGPGVPTSYPLPPPSGPTGPQNGWNDPPTLNRVPKKKVPEHYTPPAPITAPIMAPLGDPQSPSTVQPQQMNAGQPGIQPGIQNPYLTIQQPQASTPGYPAIPTMNPEGAPGGPIGDVIQPTQSMPAEKITKKPIPEEHIILKTTFEGLIQRCLAAATDPQTKRKLDDANKRLEFLYDKLREQTLSPAIVGGLHNMARSIETRSYADGLSIHTHIVSNSNFSETSAFMPVLKVVLTQANKLGV